MHQHSTSTLKWKLAAALCGLIAFAAGCSDTKLAGKCQTDSNCPAGYVCGDGECRCKDDGVCDTGEFCNQNTGHCQANLGCTNSFECPKGQFCDLSQHKCLDEAYCTSDVQCELGEVCDTVSYKCVQGCRTVGDCNLGAICVCPEGQNCAPGDILTCEVGPCGDDSYCRYGEKCIEDPPGAPKRCVRDTSGPFCQPCTIGPGQKFCPGSTPNYCLIDTSKNFASNFCGVDCSQDQNRCPWGFGCSDVLELTGRPCGGSAECVSHKGPTCSTDADCTSLERGNHCDPQTNTCRCSADADCNGGVCDTSTGECKSKCVAGEGDVQGFCTCIDDTDCPVDSCDSSSGRCRISQKVCNPSDPNSCQIHCKTVQDKLTKEKIGYCFIGQNCAPVAGVTCDMVLSGQ